MLLSQTEQREKYDALTRQAIAFVVVQRRRHHTRYDVAIAFSVFAFGWLGHQLECTAVFNSC